MEGTRHEKAALIAIAYSIGALTAFIWYGLGQTEVTTLNYSAESMPASVINSTVTQPEPAAKSTDEEIVTYRRGVLEVSAIDGTRVLSFNAEKSGYSDTGEFAIQGTHVGELFYTVSPSSEYVFFCELKTEGANTCSPFVYDVLSDTIYPVRKNGEAVDLITSATLTVSWGDSGLTIGEDTSADRSKPWLLGA